MPPQPATESGSQLPAQHLPQNNGGRALPCTGGSAALAAAARTDTTPTAALQPASNQPAHAPASDQQARSSQFNQPAAPAPSSQPAAPASDQQARSSQSNQPATPAPSSQPAASATATAATQPATQPFAKPSEEDAAATTPVVCDEDLMHGLCNGSNGALGELMRRWEVPLKSFLLRLGVPSADVEDTAQEAFVRLYLKRDAYRSGAPFKPWLLTLAANLGRNRMRWRLRRREQSIEPLFETGAAAENPHGAHAEHADPAAPAPSDLAEQKQRRAAVRAIVAALPDKLRQAVVCVDLEGLSHAEAAAVLDCTPKAVENRLHRARERIRDKCAHWLAEGKL